jgi:hypothetical protein
MGAVYGLAVGNVSLYGQAISDACASFKNFTENKIEEMDDDDVTRDMMEAFFTKTLDVLVDLLPGAEGLTIIGSLVRDTLISGVRGVLEYPMSHMGGEIDEDELKKLMRDLAESANALKQKWYTPQPGGDASVNGKAVLPHLSALVSKLQNNLRANVRSAVDSDRSQRFFLDTFYDADVDEKQALLSHYYAVPTPVQSAQAGWTLYKQLLKLFAPVYAWATASKRDQLAKASGQVNKIPGAANMFRSEGELYWHDKRAKR